MAYEGIKRRHGRNRGRNSEPLSIPQQDWRGVNYVDDIYSMPGHHLSNAQNTDMGNPIGSITKVAGRESLFSSLGSGQILGLHTWKHINGDRLLSAWDKYLYLLSGSAGSIAKTSQADWEAGTRTHINTTASAGDMKISISGTNFSETDTLTADFNGTHSNTQAVSDTVRLATSTDTNTKLLLHCNGVNESTTFTDETGKTVTAYGNALISTYTKKFGTASGLFDGVEDYLSVPDSADWYFGTGDFTIDLWARFEALPGSGDEMWFVNQLQANYGYWIFYVENVSGTYYLKFAFRKITTPSYIVTISNTITLTTNIWTHLAIVRNGNNFLMFKDGTQIGTTQTDSNAIIDTTESLIIGGVNGVFFHGFLDEIRISKSVARWTANFTPPAVEYNIIGYVPSGTYTHTTQNISSIVLTTGVTISFNKTTPTNTTLTLETNISTNGGSTWGGWTARTSGATIVPSGTDVSNYRVQWRALLTSIDNTVTPTLNDVTLAGNSGYFTIGDWISPVYDMTNTPLTAILSWVQTILGGTAVAWYARGSGNGTIFGDWKAITVSGDAIPLSRYCQIKAVLTGTVTATPTVSSLLVSYSMSYSQANRLDISPLGRTSNLLTGNRVRFQDYEDNCYCADGLRPFVLYVNDSTAATGTAQAGTISTITLAAGASAINDFYNNAFVTITAGPGLGKTRFISDYDGTTKNATVSVPWSNNLLTANQASVETNTTGFASIGATLSRSNEQAWSGTYSLKCVTPGSVAAEGFQILQSSIAATAGSSYIGQLGLIGSGTVYVYLRFFDASGIGISDGNFNIYTLNGSWQQCLSPLTVSPVNTAYVGMAIRTYNTVQAVTFYADKLKIEQNTAATDWDLNPDATSTYSIGSAVKVRKAGVDPPGTAPTLAIGAATGLTGTFYGKVTFVNADGYESNPSVASGSVTVSNQKIDWTIPVDSSTGNTTASRKLYRTKAGGSVYYYVTTISNNTSTTYTDSTADGTLTILMEDNNNIPPNASIVYSFVSYMFYTNNDELWFSKAGSPEQVPNITGDIQVNVLPGTISDIKSNPMALVPMGESFINPITSNAGFIFDSDPTVDTTTMKQIDKNGSLSFEASDICIDPQLRSILVFPTNTGVRTLLPGLQEESIESVPLSRNIQTYFDCTVNRGQMAAIFYNSYYIISMEYQAPGAVSSEWVTFAYDFRTSEWYGPWTFGCSCYAITGNVLYGGDPTVGKIYRMLTGSSNDGANIHMIVDLRMISPAGENRTYKYNKFMAMVSAESDTSVTVVKPKVDEREATVPLGTLSSGFTGDTRPGHDNIRSRKYHIPLARGSTLSYRIEDDSTNPFSLQKMITEAEVLRLKR